MVLPVGCVPIAAAVQLFTVTVAVLLFAPVALQEFVTFTQYDVVLDGETWIEAVVPPPTGDEVSPEVPTYHWYVKGDVPVAVTLSVACEPCVIVLPAGCVPIAAGVQAGPVP